MRLLLFMVSKKRYRLNEFQILTYSVFLAVVSIVMIFFGYKDDDDDNSGMLMPIIVKE